MNSVATPSSADPSSPVVRVENVWKSYERGCIEVLQGVTFNVYPGELLALCGPSGCGKSTLLHLIGGLDAVDRGQIYLHDTPLDGERNTLHHLRHNIGFVFQLHNLIPDLTLEENCLIPAVGAGRPRAQARERLAHLSRELGLEPRLHHRIQQLSGGERQRTAICRALMNSPRLILADEPTGSLDEKNRQTVFELLLGLVRKEGASLLMATHDRALAEQCDRLLVVKDGRLHQTP